MIDSFVVCMVLLSALSVLFPGKGGGRRGRKGDGKENREKGAFVSCCEKANCKQS